MATRAQPSPKCLEELSLCLRPPQSERNAWEQSDDLSTYTDGKRVVWTNGSQFMTKLDHDTFDIISTLRLPGNDHADTLTREQFIKAFDSKSNFDQKRATVKKSGYPPISAAEIGPSQRFAACTGCLVRRRCRLQMSRFSIGPCAASTGHKATVEGYI
ncbi:hypothetical protein ACMX25_34870 [Caballeronia sp. 15715]|uniref:hypothetical protein n=1 Tax=Caballeronia sp. 15715 TaxID=3391030 RepID=UPI0039E70C2E